MDMQLTLKDGTVLVRRIANKLDQKEFQSKGWKKVVKQTKKAQPVASTDNKLNTENKENSNG